MKEEEEKDTESVVDDGGKRSVAEDAERRRNLCDSFASFRRRGRCAPDRSANSPARSPADDGNGFCFMDSSSSGSDADADADGNGASAATSSTSSSAEWAERWEREQWERKHGGASGGASGAGHAERLDEHSNEHSDDANLRGRRRNGANGRGYDEFHGGDPYGDDDRAESAALHADDVFGADELAGILNASTRDRMGSVDFSGVARGPCRTCRKRGAGGAGSDPGAGSNPGDGSGSVCGVVAPCFAFASIADWDAGVAVGTSPGTPPLPYLLPENNVGLSRKCGFEPRGRRVSAFDAWRAYEEVRNLRAELVEAPGGVGLLLLRHTDERPFESDRFVFDRYVVPGARTCARCGCPAECHATNRELPRAKRQSVASRPREPRNR